MRLPALAILVASALVACGNDIQRDDDESTRAFVERIRDECAAEHGDDISVDETFNTCVADEVEEAVDRGELSAAVQEGIRKGTYR